MQQLLNVEKLCTDEEAIRELMNSSSYYFYRSFIDCKKSRTALAIVNDLFETDRELEPSLLILSILPAMNWVLKAESLDNITSTVFLSDGVTQHRLDETQKLLIAISGCEPRLMLKKRKDGFAKIRFVVDSAKDKINCVEMYPGRGHVYSSLLRSFYLGEETDVGLSQYMVRNFLEDAIRIFDSMMGDAEKKTIYELISPDDDCEPDTELQFVYHNVSLLIEEYCKILFYAKYSDDKAMKLLSCSTESEMLALTESDTKYNQAYLLVEYVKLIGSAIELLKEFPVERYYDVVIAMIEQKQGNTTERNTAEMMAMSLTSYRELCRKAMAVLAVALFGSGCRIFVDMLVNRI